MTESASVLVVDDNEDLVETFSMILKRRGFCVDTAANGVLAVDKFRMHHFDVILMDIVMPEMNGVEAFRKIREMSPGATVILMTAYSEDELIKAALSEGAHRVVHKPISIEKMIQMIKEAAMHQPVLLVDDDDDILVTMTRTLESQGYQVLAASSGEEAISLVENKPCGVAFIDIKLPAMNGLETCLRLREINSGIKTIMMTGYREEVQPLVDEALAASAVTCLYKPFDPLEAVGLLGQLDEKPNCAGCRDEKQKEYIGRR